MAAISIKKASPIPQRRLQKIKIMSVIEVVPSKCKLCYACIRACPAKAIKAEDGHVEIIDERCINCGS